MSSLSAHGLVHAYASGPRALAGVDLVVAPGELACVLGPNGSGKSTLLRALDGVLVPGAGEVRLDGRPLRGLPVRARARRIAAVPQVLAALPDEDVWGFVLGGRYPHLDWLRRGGPRDAAAVRRALEEVDALPWARRRLRSLSGGQGQRVLVARALAQEADYLLLDEPTAALDPEHQVLLFELFATLARGGRGVLVATHELALAGRFADRVALLDEGRVVAQGPPEAVLRPEVLEPVFGAHLHFASGPDASGRGRRPLVVPWPAATPTAPTPPQDRS